MLLFADNCCKLILSVLEHFFYLFKILSLNCLLLPFIIGVAFARVFFFFRSVVYDCYVMLIFENWSFDRSIEGELVVKFRR